MPYTDAGTDINKVRLQPELIENIAASYIKQVLHAVESLHSHGLAHCDLKSDNVVVSRWADVEVGNFGWASLLSRTEVCRRDRRYMAPEVVCAWHGEKVEAYMEAGTNFF
ncbi:serine/threonine-protein kinase grp-like protein [Aphelenchoides avenae]|nr:serine/threonine-protein kinase grp-like protein [Aphelenchus avenae]